jgi:4-hydroxybenzoate polyprenyltransferase/phosphoserine phosphatase
VSSLPSPANDLAFFVDPTMPLCVDLDGTLVNTDLTVESICGALRRSPWLLLALPLWMLRGKHRLKAELARRAPIDVSVLPYNEAVLQLISGARAAGRRTVLVTGSNQHYADLVAAHLGLFDEVFGSNDDVNLTGTRKAELLNTRYAQGAYEYVANGAVDLPIWKAAGAAVTVNANRGVVERAAAMNKPHTDIPAPRVGLSSWLKAIRLHQWAKNALIFVPLITSHHLLEPQAVVAALCAFLAFGMCASATYIFNDLLDLDSDRHHRSKKRRPFAAGILSIRSGMIVSAALLASGIALGGLLSPAFQFVLFAYLASTLTYSVALKRVASLDVLILAGLYTLRIIAGAFAADISLSFWLLAFSMFIFLCLALVKRVAELIEIDRRAGTVPTEQAKGRDYDTSDIPILQILGATSGYLAVLVLALYINSEEVLLLYRTPELLWLIAPLLLLWVTRLWVVTTRGYMDDDPVFFAIKDPESWVTAGVAAAIIFGATQFQF